MLVLSGGSKILSNVYDETDFVDYNKNKESIMVVQAIKWLRSFFCEFCANMKLGHNFSKNEL